jgi:CRP-like cAMP-binding protein
MLNAVSLEEVHAGDILGEMGVIDHSPRSTTVVAETQCTFAKIDEKRFYYLVQQTPYFGIEVMKVMAKRLRQCDLHLAEAMARAPGTPLQ